MKILEDYIVKYGKVLNGEVLQVGGFLNQKIDIALSDALAEEFHRLFKDDGVNKILSIEASGLPLAALTARRFGCEMVFAKKTLSSNISGEVYSAKVFSFTKMVSRDIIVAKDYLTPNDRILIIDDFLAYGSALKALRDIIDQSGATLIGAGIAVEKAFQPGGKLLRESGLRIESLARIESMDPEKGITFC